MTLLIDDGDAAPEVRAVYNDIRATRKTDIINNFWKAMAIVALANQTNRLAIGYDVPVDEAFK